MRKRWTCLVAIVVLATGSAVSAKTKDQCVDAHLTCNSNCASAPEGTNSRGQNLKDLCTSRCVQKASACVAAASDSKSIGPVGGNGTGTKRAPISTLPTAGTNKGPSGPTPTGTHPIVNPPTSAGTNKEPSGGGTTTIEKSSGGGGKH